METYKPTDSSSVLSWSPPNPPNGIILYYNIRITHSDSGELVATVEAFSNTTIDISDYIDSNGNFNVEVHMYNYHSSAFYTMVSHTNMSSISGASSDHCGL